MNKVDYLEEVIGRQLQFIQSTDNRSMIMLTLSLAILATIQLTPDKGAGHLMVLGMYAGIVFSLLFFACSFFRYKVFNQTTLIVFGLGIKSDEDYINTISKLDADIYEHELLNQSMYNSEAIKIKGQFMKLGLAMMIITTAPWFNFMLSPVQPVTNAITTE